jgi:hypothetical protein
MKYGSASHRTPRKVFRIQRGNKAEGGCGLWIIRDGLSQEVHRNARGTRLQAGDEIHLGRAVLKFK